MLANRGAAGVDHLTLAAVEAYGAERMLAELQAALRTGSYHPAPVRRVHIPKPDGSQRPLGIPTVTDRVCQQAVKIVLEPVFEADFLPCSYGFRPKRSATQAMEELRTGFIAGNCFVFEADIKNFFDSIDHDLLLKAVSKHTDLRWVLLYVKRWLEAPLAAGGRHRWSLGIVAPHKVPRSHPFWLICSSTTRSTPGWPGAFPGCPFERYADDAVVHCKSEDEARLVLAALSERMAQVGLELHPDKTRIVYCKDTDRTGSSEHEQFDVLGLHVPSQAVEEQVREAFRELLSGGLRRRPQGDKPGDPLLAYHEAQ